MMRRWSGLLALDAMLLLMTWAWDTPVQGVEGSRQATPPCPAPCHCSHTSLPSDPRMPLLTVNCSGRGLTRFPGNVPNATQVLLLSHNALLNLSSLPPLPALRVMDLSFNRIAFLDNHWVFEHMGRLTRLDLSGNALRTLQHGSFSGLQSLEELDLSDNNIGTVELHAFGGLNHLSALRLARNQLYELKRSWLLSMTSLRELYLQGNYLAVVESNTFDKITSLLHVDLSDNSLRRVRDNGFLGLERLKLLNLSENSFVGIPTRELQRLTSLDILLMDGIRIGAVQEGDFRDVQVSSLSLSFLPGLQVVKSGAFSNMSRLRTLQLHDNPRLLFIHPHAFARTPLLHRLLLHNNELVTLSQAIRDSLPALDDLHLYHNPLHCDCNILWLRRDMAAAAAGQEASYIQDADRLVCSSPALNTNMLLRHVPLQLLSPVCAPTTLPFFSDSRNVSIGDDLHLECQAIGVPDPSLLWILPDGQTLNATDGRVGISGDGTTLTLAGLHLSDQGTYGCRANNSVGYDISSTLLVVRNMDLRLSLLAAANDQLTVAWEGSVPRQHMARFQIVYHQNGGHQPSSAHHVYLHGGMHRCTLTGLRPMTSYRVCLLYQDTYTVHCRNFSTDHKVALAQPAITRVDMTRVVAGVCAVVGVVVVLCLVRAVARRLRRRKDYEDPLKESGDMDKIPLEPLDPPAPQTPLCSSRTALLPHSQI